MSTRKTSEEKSKIDLLDLVLSWPFTDILNNNLLKDKVVYYLKLITHFFLLGFFFVFWVI